MDAYLDLSFIAHICILFVVIIFLRLPHNARIERIEELIQPVLVHQQRRGKGAHRPAAAYRVVDMGMGDDDGFDNELMLIDELRHLVLLLLRRHARVDDDRLAGLIVQEYGIDLYEVAGKNPYFHSLILQN